MTRSKRGISTIIGALFFMFVVIGAMTMMSWASQQQHSFSSTASEVGRLQLDRAASALEVTDVRIDNNKFNITLQNNGALTENIVRLWATNETVTNWHNKYEVNYIANPKQALTNVGQDLPVVADSLDAYKLKFVTDRGNLITFRSLSVAQADLKLSMYISPPTISTGENVTIMMSVTNNAKDVDSVHNLQPSLSTSYSCVLLLCPTAVEKSAPSSIKSLARDSTALFKWIYTVQGPPDSKVTFTGTLVGANPASAVSDSVTIKPVIADSSSVTSIITSNSGVLAMNYTTFQFCKPSTQDCRSNSADWKPGWQVNINTQYLWRVNITNNGSKDIFLDHNSAMLLLHVQTGGGGNMPSAIYIKDDSTTTDEDPLGGYINYSKRLPAIINGVAQPTRIYFGVTAAGGTILQQLDSQDVGMSSVNIVLFGYQDTNGDNIYTPAIDTSPYSQNLPFQGLFAS